MLLRPLLLFVVVFFVFTTQAQRPGNDKASVIEALTNKGVSEEDVSSLRLADNYTDPRTGIVHTWYRQQWLGLDVFNSEVAVHTSPDGGIISLSYSLANGLRKKATDATPAILAEAALTSVLRSDAQAMPTPSIVRTDPATNTTWFEGDAFNGEEPFTQLVWVRVEDSVRLAWNVNYQDPKGDHWWNVRVDAFSGKEIDRNDWIANCPFDHHTEHDHFGDVVRAEEMAPLPAGPNDYRVYATPLESPSHGARSISNAPWTIAPNASPYGWHDTNGASGAEYTITRGNNVNAQEDANNNNGTGYSPSGGPSLDFDFPLNLSNSPATYQDASIANLFYWNNIIHDVLYQYGFNEASGNFQSNNYGQGGLGSDHVNADGQDGGGTDNANFATPPDGSSPRMQMYIWTYTGPNRDSGLDNGVIVHEYGHGISNRLVGGPSNVDCLGNAEQMGEGWSDWYGLMLTMRQQDTRTAPRGIGTYLLGQPTSGNGLRPVPYSTSFSTNAYTYANTNSGVSQPHGIGFVWCTILWEMTWDLIDQYGFDPDFYNGTGGNNIAMDLVTEGLKLTACSPGFVDGRDAILLADNILYGGANQSLIWGAFARRGLGYSASQGSSSSRSDQVEAFDLPFANNVGIQEAIHPSSAGVVCSGEPVKVRIFNSGLAAQGGFNVRFRLNGGPWVTEAFIGPLAASASVVFTFATPLSVIGDGPTTLEFQTLLPGDQYPQDDQLEVVLQAPADLPFLEDLESALVEPPGWDLENPDQGMTWTNSSVTNGPLCAATRAWRINFYSYNNYGQEDRLISPPIDLTAAAGTKLRFHQAHARYSSSYEDSLRVQVSADCGASWSTIWQVQGTTMATAPNSTSNWAPSSCAQWTLRDLDLSAYDGQVIQVRFVGITGYGNNLYLDNIEIIHEGVQLSLRMLLEGPFDAGTGLMHDDLRTASLIPTAEPYTAQGLAHIGGGGGESVHESVFSSTGNDAIVDWVMIELRAAGSPTTVIATRSALLQRDGDVVAVNGSSPIVFNAPAGPYYIAVRHRNHLACMTANTVQLNASADVVHDLGSTTPTLPTYGTDARKAISGKLVLRSGDVNGSGQLRYIGAGNDRDLILQAIGGVVPTTTATGYMGQDVNLDGVVKYSGANNDRDPILMNIGGTVPTAVRDAQMP